MHIYVAIAILVFSICNAVAISFIARNISKGGSHGGAAFLSGITAYGLWFLFNFSFWAAFLAGEYGSPFNIPAVVMYAPLLGAVLIHALIFMMARLSKAARADGNFMHPIKSISAVFAGTLLTCSVIFGLIGSVILFQNMR
ncbi:hypothetical protein [Acuticoccus yangtzensis]|uniref:hypothetical protein n=1 Tax=Acuticoccus yangtzensis TaxID=1443441 RepID=UPI001300B6A8|nr:hypothetical protein [Acuticoccus yangtzensis]